MCFLLVLGILDQSADSENLKQGSKVELPFWMVPTLHAKKIITFEVPRYYKVNYRFSIYFSTSKMLFHC
jgi:hypothetical protein